MCSGAGQRKLRRQGKIAVFFVSVIFQGKHKVLKSCLGNKRNWLRHWIIYTWSVEQGY